MSHVLIARGKAFYKTGLAVEKDRSPIVTYLAFGMTRRCRLDDLKFLPGVYGLINSERYVRASPRGDLKVRRSNLYLIRDCTGRSMHSLEAVKPKYEPFSR